MVLQLISGWGYVYRLPGCLAIGGNHKADAENQGNKKSVPGKQLL
jgi:hypothetical protein